MHAGMCPTRAGAATRAIPDVITTQQLTAAVSGRESPVRVVVAVSSTEAYTPRGASPLWRREDEELPAAGPVAGTILEAERYLRDLADGQPHISVAVLRLADLAGPATWSPLTSLWRRPIVPYVAGYDPPIQVLHIDDAAAAVEHAVADELAGTMNVAGPGVVPWRTTAPLVGRAAVPAPIVPDAAAAVLAALGVPHVPASLAGGPALRALRRHVGTGGERLRSRAHDGVVRGLDR